MTTVFISYSRKDADFVRRLHEALAAQDRQTWVDWEGIPPTAEWMKEIVGAIDAAAAFVFIMTPDSLGSTVCSEELAHAAAQNKRLIPIVRRDVEASSVPESLARLNWIFFRDHDDFPSAMQTLVSAIDTDLDWVQAHTRLLVRAREWDAKGRDNSLALRGTDLKAAEQWLTLGPTKKPNPTELQTLFILQSRKTATNRRYLLLGVAMAGVLVVAVLGTTTYFERRERARQQTIAVAGRLTADAELARDQPDIVPNDTGWLERSVLLATEAASQLDALGVRSLQTDIAMRRGLALLPRRLARIDKAYESSDVDAMVLTEDGRILAVSKSPLSIEHWSAGGESIANERVAGEVAEVAFSPDGMFLATTELNHVPGVLDIWEAATLKPVARLSGLGDKVEAFALSPSATYLVASIANFDKGTNTWVPDSTRVWDMASAGYPEIARLPHATALSFSPEGAWLAGIVESVPKVWKVKDDSGVSLEEIPLAVTPSNAWNLMFSSDGKQLVVGFQNNSIKAWTVGDWKVVHEFVSETLPWAVGPNGNYTAVRGNDYTARILDSADGGEVARLHAADLIGAIAFRPNSQDVAVAGLGKTIELWQVDSGGSDIMRIAAGAEIHGASFGTDESTLTILAGAGEKLSATSWPLENRREPSRQAVELFGELAALSADGRFIAVASSQAATMLNASDGRTIGNFPYQGKATAIALSPEGASLAIATDGGVVLLWQAGTSQDPVRFSVRGQIAQHHLAVGPSGTILVAVATEGVTRRGETLVTHYWQPPNNTEAARNPVGVNRSGLTALPCTLSADARYLTVNEGNGAVAVRETRGGRAIGTVNHPGGGDTCAFSADSRLLATSGSGLVRIWDAATWVEIARIEHAADVRDLVFSPNGRYLATIGDKNVSRVWLLRPAELIEAACARVTRNLNRDEWRDYFGDKPYRATCPGVAVPRPGAPEQRDLE